MAVTDGAQERTLKHIGNKMTQNKHGKTYSDSNVDSFQWSGSKAHPNLLPGNPVKFSRDLGLFPRLCSRTTIGQSIRVTMSGIWVARIKHTLTYFFTCAV